MRLDGRMKRDDLLMPSSKDALGSHCDPGEMSTAIAEGLRRSEPAVPCPAARRDIRAIVHGGCPVLAGADVVFLSIVLAAHGFENPPRVAILFRKPEEALPSAMGPEFSFNCGLGGGKVFSTI